MIRTSRLRALVSAVLVITAFSLASSARAQTPWAWPERGKNLKVLPKDTPPEKLRAIMTGYTRALGVRCTFCHVGEEGKPLDTYDFPSDKKEEKNTARRMVKMLGNINKTLASIQPDKEERVNMQCGTCHRGRPLPRTLAEELTRLYGKVGVDSTATVYRSLRDRFYGSGAYDFREGSLIEVAHTALDKNDAQAALKLLNLDAEFYPESGPVHDALGQAYLAAGDTAQAITHYEKAVSVEPRNQAAKRALEALKKGAVAPPAPVPVQPAK